MKLKELRKARGVQQNAVAQMLGITRQTYAIHELKPWTMRQGEALAVCDFLGVSPEDVDDFILPSDVKKMDCQEAG